MPAAKEYRTIDPRKVETKDLHQYIVGAIAPRPIAFVSTLDAEGRANVAPYSFFNAFSSNPPILVFSSNRRVADNTTKDTLANIRTTGECVINMVNFDIVRQMTLASIGWPHEVSEFDAAGLTPLASDTVKAFRVKESPVHMECVVQDVITLGEEGGAGHLIICKVQRVHVEERVIDERDRIDPHKLDLMGRLGRSYYVRASGDAVFPIVQPVSKNVIGWQAVPGSVRNSKILTGNEIAQLAGAFAQPEADAITEIMDNDPRISQDVEAMHLYVRELLAKGQTDYALAAIHAAEVKWSAHNL